MKKKINFIFIIFLIISNGLTAQDENPWKDKSNWTSLMKATEKKSYNKMNRLLKKGKNDISSNYPITSLDIAIKNQDTLALKILLSTNLYNYNNVGDLVMVACYENSLDVLKMLINFGFPIKTEPQNNLSPLLIAVQFSSYEVVEFLLQQKEININQQQIPAGYTALIRATIFGRIDIIKLLLRYGADKNLKTTSGNTAIYFVQYIDKSKVSEIDIKQIEELLK